MSEIWAKSAEGSNEPITTLKEHVFGLLNQLEHLKQVIPSVISYYYTILRLAIFAHDLGKVSPSYQLTVGNWDYKPKPTFPQIPHSLFSLLWIDKEEIKREIKKEKIMEIPEYENYLRTLFSAIAFHHWRDNFERIILGKDVIFKRAVKQVLEDSDFRESLLDNLKNQFKGTQFDKFLKFDEELARLITQGADILAWIIPPYHNYFLPQRLALNEDLKKKFILTLGFLLRIDHFASFVQKEGLKEPIEKKPPEHSVVEETLKKEIQKKGTGSSSSIWQLDVLKNDHKIKNGNVILVSPTGSGKTEFAFLWGSGEKIFFTLPLRSAVNSIFERAIGYFKKENVGLLHSDADVYLFTKTESLEGENFKILDLARHLSLPVIVSTGDQIFPCALKYPGYEKVYSALSYSRLVIDEVQAYDPKAVAIIVKLIEDIVNLGGKFLLMTATLPEFVVEEINKRIGKENYTLINRYKKGNPKHYIQLRNGKIEDCTVEILNKAKEGKRILVILNTVTKAQKVFDKISEKISRENGNKDIYVKLIHSKFTIKDRKEIEEEIMKEFSNPKPLGERKGKILISTQVIEASLDIDVDILYTDVAPLDALVQRMGRVMRRIKEDEVSENPQGIEKPNVFVFKREKEDFIIYHPKLLDESFDLLKTNVPMDKEEEGKPLSEMDKKKLVEDFFKKVFENSEYRGDFYNTLNILDAGYVSDKKQEALRIFREIYTIPAIPSEKIEELRGDIEEFLKNDRISYTAFKANVLSKYVVSVDIRPYVREDRLSIREISYIVHEIDISEKNRLSKVKEWLNGIYEVDLGYDKEKGLLHSENKKWDSMII